MPGPVFLHSHLITLRTVEEEDLDFLQENINDPSVWRAIGSSSPINAPQEREYFENIVCNDEEVNLLVAVDDAPAGMVTLSPNPDESDAAELGYWIASEYRQQGYGRDAARLVTNYGFQQLGLHRISARVFAFNDASQALLESIGFVKEGINREAVYVDGRYWDTYWYSMLASEWDRTE